MPAPVAGIGGKWRHPRLDAARRWLCIRLVTRFPLLACRIWNGGHWLDLTCNGKPLVQTHYRLQLKMTVGLDPVTTRRGWA